MRNKINLNLEEHNQQPLKLAFFQREVTHSLVKDQAKEKDVNNEEGNPQPLRCFATFKKDNFLSIKNNKALTKIIAVLLNCHGYKKMN